MEAAFQEAFANAYDDANAYEDEGMRNHYIAAYQEALEKHTQDTYNTAFDAAYAKYTNEESNEVIEPEEKGFFANIIEWFTGPSRGEFLN